MSVNSDRKASLERVIKLQQEQLEQWENKMVISNDPDTKRLCQVRIDELKELLKKSHDELKKLGRGKQQPIITGVNEPKKEVEEEPEEETASAMDSGSAGARGGKNIGIAGGGGNNNNGRGGLLYFILGFLAMGVLAVTLFVPIENVLPSTPVKIGAFILTIVAIAVIYRYLNLTPGIKLALAIIVLCIYAIIVFWNVILIAGDKDPKTIGEIVIIPLIIAALGSMIQVINEEKKRSSR